MTTLIGFVPSTSGVPQFQATLDGGLYTVSCPWNVFAQDYYVSIAAQDGTIVYYRPLTVSPDDYDFNLIEAVFTTSTLIYRGSNTQFEINP